ncbi:dimethyladenosine transferase [Dysgonomonas sp. 216]|uniref:FkbM family methyltransferase n=1 Tax=Dysgonomonas sp. 216 TaxID=2302934 RepID=UPI0013D51188|nr:FkbM family methyltransferase [Dysgonomonas sp. 216]NDW17690.1 dimethyladenosine transferase [Dysgonomonas sp. 216]
MGIIKEIKKLFNKKKKLRERAQLISSMREYYDKNPQFKDEKIEEALSYIEKNGWHIFPYEFNEKYKADDIDVLTDSESGLRYVMHNGNRLYFRRKTKESRVKRHYSLLLCEQDPESAHSYISESFGFEKGDILFDIGAAEGNFSLSMVEKASKIYLFESDKEWDEPLKKTFEPWKDKVVIIHKFVSDIDSETCITIDSVVKDLEPGSSVFLKMDVEGAETSVIAGAKKIFDSGNYNVKTVICTYHEANDYVDLSDIMHQKKYAVETSSGYMIFSKGKFVAPYFRRGVIRCSKSMIVS